MLRIIHITDKKNNCCTVSFCLNTSHIDKICFQGCCGVLGMVSWLVWADPTPAVYWGNQLLVKSLVLLSTCCQIILSSRCGIWLLSVPLISISVSSVYLFMTSSELIHVSFCLHQWSPHSWICSGLPWPTSHISVISATCQFHHWLPVPQSPVSHRIRLYLWRWLSSWGAIEHADSKLQLNVLANFRFSTELTWMGIKCKWAAPLDSPNFIGPNFLNSYSKTS